MSALAPVWVAFATGLFLGGFVGMAFMCVFIISRPKD